jgi:hypothetical protein
MRYDTVFHVDDVPAVTYRKPQWWCHFFLPHAAQIPNNMPFFRTMILKRSNDVTFWEMKPVRVCGGRKGGNGGLSRQRK